MITKQTPEVFFWKGGLKLCSIISRRIPKWDFNACEISSHKRSPASLHYSEFVFHKNTSGGLIQSRSDLKKIFNYFIDLNWFKKINIFKVATCFTTTGSKTFQEKCLEGSVLQTKTVLYVSSQVKLQRPYLISMHGQQVSKWHT